jgi:hypothetical protein
MIPVTFTERRRKVRPKTPVPALIVVIAICLAPAADRAAADPTPHAVPAAELTWADLDPAGAPGVRFALLWGDLAEGPFGAFFELPAGFAAPLHSHTHDMKLVIVSGTYLQAPAGQAELRLGPGSYLLQPGGDYLHTTSCDPASACVFFVESDGGFDLIVTPEPAAQAPSAATSEG